MTRLRSGFMPSLRDGGIGARPAALHSQWLPSYHGQKAQLALIEAAAAQVADGFTLAGHWGSVIVIQLVLLGLSN